ncbi:DUF2199 domain-containing protein [Kaistella palustris]|uniref:DUF2199 domain-containing protein n=1 Tax=Kaistella palustris TaxID=493376 RepID=UPI000427F9EF|nr:DUF2199 domain-containing protein [Kaistella palustris]
MSIENKCGICGEIHTEYPAFTFTYPNPYYWLTDEQKSENVKMDADFCTIQYPDRVDRFIKVVMRQKIKKSRLYLDYILWVALDEDDYNDYLFNFGNENHEGLYFGWLSNALPDYKFEKSIPMDVKAKTGNQRPEVYPVLDFSHPFVADFYHGITKEEAEKRVHHILARSPR